jgi:gamma-glutamylcyclotransferase (GGCT)/AIG2-like uncharacterized protein YtfP
MAKPIPSAQEQAVHHLFAYGTLMRGQSRERYWPHAPVRIDRAVIRAALYDLGPYPAIGPGDDLVRGEVWQIRPDQIVDTLGALDEVEGFAGSEDDLYVRRLVHSQLDDGRRLLAWTYYYANLPQLNESRRIAVGPHGWCDWQSAARERS